MRRDVFWDRRGSISILSALTIVGVIGFSALALEYGYGLLQQVENQRIADLAAYSGALVYNSTSSSSSANSAVGNIASLNGLTSSAASASVVSSPSGDGNQAVQVTVATNVPLRLARVLTTSTTMPVAASASAEINANAPGRIIALSGSGTGISLSGTGSITANNCQVESNSTVCANSGANPGDKITTKYLSYGSGTNLASSNCTISPPSGTSSVHISKATASDPLAGNSEVSGATGRISTVASMTSPSGPSGVPTGTNAAMIGTNPSTLNTEISNIVNNLNGTGWATSTVNVNNSNDTTGCYCPSGSPGSWSWGATVTCGSSCTGGGIGGQFVTITANRSVSSVFPTFGYVQNGTITRSVLVETQ
jgi:Putative Flp pilus-assembly TadE/G-like